MPGVSSKVICPSGRVTMPRTTRRVVCGLSVTMEIFSPTMRFKSVDFPEFGRPMIETKPDLVMCLRYESFEPQPLHTPPICREHLNFNSSVLDLFPGRGQSSE